MGKNEFLTPKAIANRIKAKGLQKLRWYCQMCQKQCRDENGFKCHCLSESHQRQMQVFGQNPHRIIGGYSEEFEETFLEHMKRSHRFSRVAATVVYNEYVSDRHHIHMNATQWATLTEFVKYLGRTGKCKVEETPKGWFITYIDRESEAYFKEKQKNKRLKSEAVEEEKQEKAIAKQIEKAEQLMPKIDDNPLSVEPVKFEQAGKIAFSFGSSKSGATERAQSSQPSNSILVPAFGDQGDDTQLKKVKAGGNSALDELMKEQESVKERRNRKDYWLSEGIVVKVMSKALAEKGYYKQKGIVQKVIDKYVGEIKMIDNGHLVRVDQQELETVIPQIGGLVRIVNGAYRGSNAKLLAIDTANYCAKVQIEKGIYDGRILQAIDYEDICKIMQ